MSDQVLNKNDNKEAAVLSCSDLGKTFSQGLELSMF